GLSIAGLSLSPNGSTLAIRLRHYSRASLQSGVQDAIRLMPASDLMQQLEVDRGAAGSGLSWSPDGRWLAFDLKGDIGVVSPAGTSMRYVTNSGAAGAPLWISDDEIWFTAIHGGTFTNQRVIFPQPG
ncbi:MAG TPA: hypothetical protein VKU87_00140, partial [Thermomicrobiaceae bacterium]|nr:hypothetical protein [Thermomicrobiaceae bacterium]